MSHAGINSFAASPENLQLQLETLACERQRLREQEESSERLERNRIEIARCQYELSYALIERHLGVECAAERAA